MALIAMCSRLEDASDVISGMAVRGSVPISAKNLAILDQIVIEICDPLTL